MDIGQKIKKIRELKNLKQDYIAQKVGLSTTAFGNIERGTSDVSFKNLEKIANSLEVSPQDILNFPDSYHIEKIYNSQVGFNNYNDNRIGFEKELMDKLVLVLDKLIIKLK